jgi:hypothetical protein
MGTKGYVKTQKLGTYNLGTIQVDPPKWEFSLGNNPFAYEARYTKIV